MKAKKRFTWGGTQVKGIVFKADYNGALIDIGAKAPAYLPLEEACIYKLKSVEEVGLVAGVEEEFSIIRDDDKNGRMILSLKKLQHDFSWERCKQLQMDDVTIRGKVLLYYNNRRLFLSREISIVFAFDAWYLHYIQALSANRGGVVVDVEGLRGFVPFSQISAVSSPWPAIPLTNRFIN
jgi:small subunit ribosomal protein S1